MAHRHGLVEDSRYNHYVVIDDTVSRPLTTAEIQRRNETGWDRRDKGELAYDFPRFLCVTWVYADQVMVTKSGKPYIKGQTRDDGIQLTALKPELTKKAVRVISFVGPAQIRRGGLLDEKFRAWLEEAEEEASKEEK